MTASRDISEPIFLQMESFRAWRWSECAELEDSERWRQSITRLDSIQRQCTSDAERTFVMRVAADSPVKNTRGPDADAEVNDWALKVLAHADEHGTKIKATASTLLKNAGVDFAAVVDRAYHLRRQRKKAAGKLCKLGRQLTKNSSARDLPSNAPPPLD